MDEPVVFLNGEFVPQSQASIKIYDAGIVLGATVTEFIRTFNREPFKLDEHIHRIFRSMKYARFDTEMSREQFREVTLELVDKNLAFLESGQELGIVQFVTAGLFTAYAGSAASQSKMTPTVCMHTMPLPLYLWKETYDKGAHLVTPSIRHVPPQCMDPKMKCRSRMHYWLADQESRQVDEHAITLLLDLDGNVTETSGANFLLVEEGVIKSPTLRNILPGVSRNMVIQLARKLDIPFVEQDLQVFHVANASEAFLATTPICLMPATRINGLPIGDGRPGPVYQRLMQAWSKEVNLDILDQIMNG